MSVKEVLGGLGSWSLRFTDELPEEVRAKFDFFGHVAILRGAVDLTQHDGAALLASARYVGVVRGVSLKDQRELAGASMELWLGDEDEKGEVIEDPGVTFTNATLLQCVTTLMPDALVVGTVFAQPDPAQRFTGKFRFVTPRSALQQVCDHFGVEYRVNGNGTVDVGTQAQLYAATPDSIVVRRGAGVDMDLVALGADFDTDRSAVDYSTDILLVGKTQEDQTFATGRASAPAVPYRDLFGNPVKRTRMISESSTETGTVTQRAQLQLNRFNRTTAALKVTADDYEIEGNFVVGDLTYVYDPDTGLVNAAIEKFFRGDVLHPDLIRISELAWSITEGHTVAYRTGSGEWVDLTRWVAWESGKNEIVVGDLPKSLTNPPGNPVRDRADALPDSSIPNPPTALQLATTSTVTSTGQNVASVLASWTPPTANTDGTALVDLSHYVVRYRPAFRAPQWTTAFTDSPQFDFPATVGLEYDVQVAAVDKANNVSAYTPVLDIVASVDTTPPAAPSDPSVTSYLGQLRIEWDGLTNTGSAMPPDFNRVDVHVGTTSGFAPSAATLVDSLSTKGISYATAPYGSTRYVRLVAYDHNQNPSSASNTVSGATVKVGDGDIASMSVGKLTAGIMTADVTVSGRFATALTGARTEMNALGLQKFDSANNLLVSITGTDALLTGRYKTALSGRRIEMGSAGLTGEINFFAPDGRQAFVRAFTEGTGVEAIQFGMQIAGKTHPLWNRINYNSEEWASYWAWRHEFHFQTNIAGKGDGLFQIYQSKAADGQGSNPLVRRLYIDKGWTIAAIDNDGTFRVEEYNVTGIYEPRFTILKTQSWFEWPENSTRVVVLSPGARNDMSGRLQLANGYSFVCHLQYLSTSTGTSSRLEIRDAGTGYVPVHGGTYTDVSRADSKTDIADFDGDALAMIRATPVRRWRRKGAAGEKPKWRTEKGTDGTERRRLDGSEPIVGELGDQQLGVIVEEVPAEWVTRDETGAAVGVQYAAQIATLIGAVQQLSAELDTIKGKVKP